MYTKPPEENFGLDSFQSITRFKYRKIQKIIQALLERIEMMQQDGDEAKLEIALKTLIKLQEEKAMLASLVGIVVT